MQKADPFRMEDVDIYSNMLYVMDKRAKLGKLAHQYAEIDHNRAEVCCLIGELPPRLRNYAESRKLLLVKSGPYESDHLFQAIFIAQQRVFACLDIDGPRVRRVEE